MNIQFFSSFFFVETLRLHPVMLALTKICTKRYELPPQNPAISKENVVIEPGTVIVLPVLSLH